MLKDKRSVSACSLSSCRIRAEALARAFNNRIWPCVWMPQRSSSAGRNDDMANGIDDEEEFFEASPSPVEAGDDSLFCQQHSSAATEAGRAKLYELLQKHVADDAIDVFYDVSEDAGLTDTCLDAAAKESDRSCRSSDCCRSREEESHFSNNSENNGMDSGCICSNDNQSINEPIDGDIFRPETENLDSDIKDTLQEVVQNSEQSITSNSISEEYIDNNVENEVENTEDSPEKSIKIEKITLEQEKNINALEESSSDIENSSLGISLEIADKIANKNEENTTKNENEKNINLPSIEFDTSKQITSCEESSLNVTEELEDQDIGSLIKKEIGKDDEVNEVTIEITKEVDSPSVKPDTDVKPTSPTCRLPVFDELRPKIIRSTSLKTGKTPPGTPSRKKIVRFADVLGLDLEDVRHIMTGDLPIIPSSAYTDLNLKDADLRPAVSVSETVEINGRNPSSWQSMQRSTATNVLYPKFSIPGEQPDFMNRVQMQGICLETMIMSEMTAQCTCRVMNYGFHKKVIARYTVNDWMSSTDIDASYVLGSSNDETDKFSFSIFLSPHYKNVQFALKYEVNGKEYWDNNRSENYCLSFHGNDPVQHIPSSVWHHQFW